MDQYGIIGISHDQRTLEHKLDLNVLFLMWSLHYYKLVFDNASHINVIRESLNFQTKIFVQYKCILSLPP